MGFEVTDTVTGHVDFSAYCREHMIATPLNKIRKIEEIELILYSTPTITPGTGVQPFGGGEDFRLYLNEHDLTECLLLELKQLIRAIPLPLVKSQYVLGVRQYLAFVNAYSDPPPVEDDLEFAMEYAEMADWGNAFEKLGDRNIGWSGNLHVLNFIYRFIPLLPVSLNDVWRRYRDIAEVTLPESISQFQHVRLTLSQGPAPSYANVTPSSFIPGGRLCFQIEYAYANPLQTALQQISSRLRNLANQLEDLRTNYLNELADGIHSIETSFDSYESSTTTALNQIKDSIDNISS